MESPTGSALEYMDTLDPKQRQEFWDFMYQPPWNHFNRSIVPPAWVELEGTAAKDPSPDSPISTILPVAPFPYDDDHDSEDSDGQSTFSDLPLYVDPQQLISAGADSQVDNSDRTISQTSSHRVSPLAFGLDDNDSSTTSSGLSPPAFGFGNEEPSTASHGLSPPAFGLDDEEPSTTSPGLSASVNGFGDDDTVSEASSPDISLPALGDDHEDDVSETSAYDGDDEGDDSETSSHNNDVDDQDTDDYAAAVDIPLDSPSEASSIASVTDPGDGPLDGSLDGPVEAASATPLENRSAATFEAFSTAPFQASPAAHFTDPGNVSFEGPFNGPLNTRYPAPFGPRYPAPLNTLVGISLSAHSNAPFAAPINPSQRNTFYAAFDTIVSPPQRNVFSTPFDAPVDPPHRNILRAPLNVATTFPYDATINNLFNLPHVDPFGATIQAPAQIPVQSVARPTFQLSTIEDFGSEYGILRRPSDAANPCRPNIWYSPMPQVGIAHQPQPHTQQARQFLLPTSRMDVANQLGPQQRVLAPAVPSQPALSARPVNTHLASLRQAPSQAEKRKMEDTSPAAKTNSRADQTAWSREDKDLLHATARQWWYWKDNGALSTAASSGAGLIRLFEHAFQANRRSRTFNQLKNHWSRNERAIFGRSEQRGTKDGSSRSLITSARPTAKAKVEAEMAKKRGRSEMEDMDEDEDEEDDPAGDIFGYGGAVGRGGGHPPFGGGPGGAGGAGFGSSAGFAGVRKAPRLV